MYLLAAQSVWFDKSIVIAVFCGVVLLIAYFRSSTLLHPHFMFTVAWVVCAPLTAFAKPRILQDNDWSTLWTALLLFAVFYAGSLIPYVPAPKIKTLRRNARSNSVKKATIRPKRFGAVLSNAKLYLNYAVATGTVMICIEVLRQLDACNFDLSDWWYHSTGPRFDRPWAYTRIGGTGLVSRLWSIFFPVAGICLGSCLSFTKGIYRTIAVVGLFGFLVLSFLAGSRTPFLMPVACLIGGIIYRNRSHNSWTLAFVVLLGALSLFGSNVMVSTRGAGLHATTDYSGITSLSVKTDDSFQRLLKIIRIDSEATEPHVAATPFLLSAGFNFVPRYIWPTKPTLEQGYFGEWRVYYTTVTAIGEFICMFGIVIGFLLTFVFGQSLQSLMNRSASHAKTPFGFTAYMYTAFLCYMLVRSILNFGIFFLPFAVVIGIRSKTKNI